MRTVKLCGAFFLCLENSSSTVLEDSATQRPRKLRDASVALEDSVSYRPRGLRIVLEDSACIALEDSACIALEDPENHHPRGLRTTLEDSAMRDADA